MERIKLMFILIMLASQIYSKVLDINRLDNSYTSAVQTSYEKIENYNSFNTNIDSSYYKDVGKAYLAPDGLTVTVNSINVIVKTGSFQYQISYTLKNNTADRSIDERTFALFKQGTSNHLPQYGFFDKLFPGDSKSRSYTFEEVGSITFDVLEYGANFFATSPSEANLKWAIIYPGNNPPNTAYLLSPNNNALGIPSSPIFSWNASSIAKSYNLQVAVSNSFSSLIYDQSGLTNTKVQVTGLTYSTQYYWRVKAINDYGSSDWSAIRNFTTINDPNKVTITTSASPTNGGTTSGGGNYNAGTTVTVIATPNSGYTFSNWTENGIAVANSRTFTFSTSANRVLVANFTTITNSLIAYYPFNGNSNDESGNGLNATNNSLTFINDRFNVSNRAGLFDHKLIEVANNNLLNFGSNTSFSICAWINFSTNHTTDLFYGLVSKGISDNSSPLKAGYQVGVYNNQAIAQIFTANNNVTVNGLKNLKDGKWHLVVLTADRQNNLYKLFVDTELDGQSFAPSFNDADINNNSSLYIGADRHARPVYNGIIDEVKIFNYVISTNELAAMFNEGILSVSTTSNLTAGGSTLGGGTYSSGSNVTIAAKANSGYTFKNWSENGVVVSSNSNYTFTITSNRNLVANFLGLVAYYPFNGNTNDQSGNGNNSSANGATLTSDRFGNQNGAYYFDGINDYLEAAISGLPLGSSARSVSAWVQMPSINNSHLNFIVSWGYGDPWQSSANKAFGFFIQNDLSKLSLWQSFGANQDGMLYNYNFTPNQFYHVVASVDGSGNFQFYINSTLVYSNQIIGMNTVSNGNLVRVGRSTHTNIDAWAGYFYGKIDEVRIYNRALTINEVLSLYQENGSPQFLVSTSSNPTNGGTTTGGGKYNTVSNITVTATANSGYSFSNWTENGTVVSTNASYTFTISGNRNLVANFTTVVPTQYSISLSSNPSGSGSTNGGGTYSSGTSVTVSATANSGYIFSNWTENGTVASTNASYTFAVNSNRTLIANFSATTSYPSIKPITLNSTISKGTEFTIQIKVGDPNAVNDLYGLSFSISSNNSNCTYVDGSAIQGDFLGNSVLFLPQKTSLQNIDIAISKTSSPGSNGSGIVASLKFATPNTLNSDQDVIFSLNNIVATNSNGNSITMSGSSLTVKIEVKKMVSVWPGDCDNNGSVLAADLLRIGQYYNQQKPGSNTPGNQWQAYAREPWNHDGSSPKIIYADANGDGTVNAGDVLPIGLNYGKTHSMTNYIVNDNFGVNLKKESVTNGSIKIGIPNKVKSNTKFTVDIIIGNPVPVVDLYGISFTLSSNQKNCGYIDNSAKDGNFFGTDIIKIYQKVNDSKIDIAISKIASPGQNGTGVIVSLEYISTVDQIVELNVENVNAVDSKGNPIVLDVINGSILVGIKSFESLESGYSLFQNYPNPFNPNTTISFEIKESRNVLLKVFDVLGNEIATVVNSYKSAGKYLIPFDAKGLSSGIYYYQLRAGEFIDTKKFILAK